MVSCGNPQGKHRFHENNLIVASTFEGRLWLKIANQDGTVGVDRLPAFIRR